MIKLEIDIKAKQFIEMVINLLDGDTEEIYVSDLIDMLKEEPEEVLFKLHTFGEAEG